MTSERTLTYDAGAPAYDRLTGRWSRLYVPSLISAAHVSSGHAVLDVAAGTGGASLGLASAVGSAGRVLAVDVSFPMLSVAARKTEGLPVRFALMDGQRLACRSQTFDAVVCQLGLMFFTDPQGGLGECWRVLRPGGRVALQVWSRPDRVPFYGLLAAALSRELPEWRAVLFQPSALADVHRLHALLTRAGFSDVAVTPERRSHAFGSFEEYWEGVEAGGSRMGQLYVGLPEGGRLRVKQEVQRSMEPLWSGSRLVLEVEAFIGQGVRRE